MLYLAEFNKPIVGKPSLKLLAKQPQQDTWQPVNEEEIQIDGRAPSDLNRFSSGSLVLAEISSNRQVTRLNEAARQLVTYLHNFSRLQDKAKSQEEEIETWKQSLTFQSQELNRREMELESQEEEIQRLFEKYQTVEEDSRVLEARKEEINALEAQLAEEKRILGQEREYLNEQRLTLEAQIEEAQQSRLTDEEAQQLQYLIDQAQQNLASISDPLAHLLPLQDLLQQRQEALAQALADWEQDHQAAQAQREELTQAWQALQAQRQEWLQLQTERQDLESALQSQQTSQSACQSYIQSLNQQLQLQETICNRVYGLIAEHDFIEAEGVEVPQAEPEISVEELMALVDQLRRRYEQRSAQVNEQLGELEQNRQQLVELEERLKTASADEQFDIEMDIDYAKSACQALEETVLPQQESLQREYEELTLKESQLAQRQGQAPQITLPKINIGPLVAQLEEQKASQQQEKAKQETQLQQLQDALKAQEEKLSALSIPDVATLDQEATRIQEQLREVNETLGALAQQQTLLVQEQDNLNQWQQQVAELESHLNVYTQAATDGQANVESVQDLVATIIQPPDYPEEEEEEEFPPVIIPEPAY